MDVNLMILDKVATLGNFHGNESGSVLFGSL